MQKLFISHYLVFLLFNLIKSQSINLLNVNIQYTRTVTSNSDSTVFRLSSPLANGIDINDAWLGVGLNDDSEMGGAHIFICRNSPNTKWVQHYFSTFYFLAFRDISNPTLGLSDSQINTDSSNITCQFAINNQVLTQVNYNEAYFMVAFGSGNPQYHGRNKAISSNKILNQAVITTTLSTTLSSTISTSEINTTTPFSPTTGILISSESTLVPTNTSSSTPLVTIEEFTATTSPPPSITTPTTTATTTNSQVTTPSQINNPNSLTSLFQVIYQLLISILNQFGLNFNL